MSARWQASWQKVKVRSRPNGTSGSARVGRRVCATPGVCSARIYFTLRPTMISLLAAQLLNGLAIGMIYALTAFGLSIIKGLLNVPNFAHGAFYALGAYVCFAAMQVGMPFGLALLVSFAVPALAGVVVEKLGVARLMSGPYLYQLLFLFGTALVLEQLIIIIWGTVGRSEEHTSELQSLMRISYAVFCLKKKKTKK